MTRTIKASITFEYSPDDDETMNEQNLTENELRNYYKVIYLEDIESYIQSNELADLVEIEIQKKEAK